MKDFTQQMVDQIFSYGELGFQEFETHTYLVDVLQEERLHGRGRRRRHSDGVHGDVGQRQAGDRARLGHRRHSAGVAEAGRRVSRADHRRRAGPRRGPQLRAGGEHHRRDRAQEDHGAREDPRHDPHLAGRRRGAASARRRTSCARACSRTSTSCSSRTSIATSRSRGAIAAAPASCPCSTASRARARTPPAAPWRGRSALDAVELMNVGWNFQREHLPLSQRSHYVITDGGDQPNVVPPTASVWYYFRQTTFQGIKDLWAIGDRIAKGAAMMTNTELLPTRVLGAAWPQHFNRAVAEATTANIQKVGMPEWSDADQTLARAVQKELGVRETGLADARRRRCRARSTRPTTPAAARTTSATSRGTCRRSRCAIRRTFPACRATTGPTPSRWRRRSRTRASRPAPRCRR